MATLEHIGPENVNTTGGDNGALRINAYHFNLAQDQINTNTTGVATAQAAVDAIEATNAIKTVKITVGAIGVAGCDFNFTTAANYTQQPKDLGSIIPAKARVLDVVMFTEAAFAVATSFTIEVGNATSGAQFIADTDMVAINAIAGCAAGAALAIAPSTSATKVWVSAAPDSGTTWAAVVAGKLIVYVTYINNSTI